MNVSSDEHTYAVENSHFDIGADHNLRILLLEDLKSDAEIIALKLRKLKWTHDIKHVTNKNDFIHALETYQPNLILSDYSLPQYTGMQALEFTRDRDPFIPFIICTGSLNEEIAVACIKAGADDYVLKDSMGRLCSAIENAVVAKENLIAKERALYDLRKSEENFRAIALNAPDSIYKIDREGKILYVNRSIDGIPQERVMGSSILHYVNESQRMFLSQTLRECYDRRAQHTVELEGAPIDGEQRWYLCRIGPVMQGEEIESLVFIASNITDRVLADRETSELNRKLQTLARHLEKVREEEKEKIAIEIHDQLGQELTGTKLALFWIKQQLSIDLDQIDLEAVLQRVDHLLELTTTTIETVRRIAHELRPVVLDNMGLVAALEWHVNNHNKSGGVECSFHNDVEELSFDKDFSSAIFRISQEALTNINRHSGATKAWIDFIVEDNELLLQIRDNGQGMDVSKAATSNSLGLFGIRERIRGWNGSLELESEPGKGSKVRVKFNLDDLQQKTETEN